MNIISVHPLPITPARAAENGEPPETAPPAGAPPHADAASPADAAVRTMNNDTLNRETRRRTTMPALVAAITLVLDQTTKMWIRANLPMGDEIAVWPGVVHLSHVLNRGAAWGMLEGQRWLLVAVTIGVLAGAVAMARSVARSGSLAASGLGLIAGGAVGNLIDRVRFGTVTDMIDLDTPFSWVRHFPVFNVADSALTVGVCLLLIRALFAGERRDSEPRNSEPRDSEPRAAPSPSQTRS